MYSIWHIFSFSRHFYDIATKSRLVCTHVRSFNVLGPVVQEIHTKNAKFYSLSLDHCKSLLFHIIIICIYLLCQDHCQPPLKQISSNLPSDGPKSLTGPHYEPKFTLQHPGTRSVPTIYSTKVEISTSTKTVKVQEIVAYNLARQETREDPGGCFNAWREGYACVDA